MINRFFPLLEAFMLFFRGKRTKLLVNDVMIFNPKRETLRIMRGSEFLTIQTGDILDEEYVWRTMLGKPKNAQRFAQFMAGMAGYGTQKLDASIRDGMLRYKIVALPKLKKTKQT